jgi:steroid delta-isomerase-like uncharacterized protein
MTAMSNKDVVRAYVDAFNRGDIDALLQIFAADAVVQGVLGWGTLDVVVPIWRELHAALRIEMTIDEIIEEGDTVAARYTERGTFVAPFRGNEPTGKSFELVAMEWFTLRDGKIVRRWGARDHASQMRQIGMPMS